MVYAIGFLFCEFLNDTKPTQWSELEFHCAAQRVNVLVR